jgi:hypothetical protein
MNADPKLIGHRSSTYPVTCGDTVPVSSGMVARRGLAVEGRGLRADLRSAVGAIGTPEDRVSERLATILGPVLAVLEVSL